MKACPNCAEQVQDHARVCPHCGTKLQLDRLYLGLGLTAVIVILGLALPSVDLQSSSPPSAVSFDSSAELQAAEGQARIERLVRARLRDPSSAQFQHFGGGCGLVNSRNGFGGMSGNQPFVVGQNDRVVRLQDDATAFKTVWADHCVRQFDAPPLTR